MKLKNMPALLLAMAIVAALFIPAAWAVDESADTLHISTADELRDFAQKCTLDTYSVGMSVVLDNSIDLKGEPFYPIPTFSGTFDGCGYTVSGLTLATDGSHQGLFRYIQAQGVVKRLKVKGSVSPEGSMEQVGGVAGTNYGEISKCVFTGSVAGLNYVGGIAGENYGTIRGCSMSGSVEGKRFTGGIAGINFGMLSGCDSSASVNTSITAGGLELEKLNLSGIISTDLTNAQDTDVVSDTGGIVGFSKGTVQNCSYSGTVGYQHYGYNVGGIAGRQSGFITDCTNTGTVLGRKDVGGIVGQMEPYKTILDSMNLAGEIATLNYLINNTMDGLAANSGDIVNTLNSIQQSAASAAGKVNVPSITIPTPAPTITPSPTPAENTATPAVEPSTAPTEPPAQPSPSAGGLKSSSAFSGGPVLLSALMPKYEISLLSAITPTADPSTPTADPAAPAPTATPDPSAAAGDLSQITSDFKTLNSQLGNSVGGLAGNLKAVSNQLSRVMSLFANVLSGSTNLDVIHDVSDKDPDSGTDGKVLNCVNKGNIDGDSNVGGVIGDMGIEYEFDLENELMGAVNEALGSGSIISTVYETKCVLHSCVNYGTVLAKKDNAGCITGAAELGAIRNCQAYGSALSTEGGYVGGIVGLSNIKISSCYAMCDLDGLEYVGGIAGYGSSITDCRTLIGMGNVTACCGAIAGWGDMTQNGISGNLFVHETLGAVDGISYSGYAEPMPYDDFMKQELPEDFKALKLSFTADGKLIKELTFSYGGSVDESEIPAVPQKSGYTGTWPEYDYSHLYFSDTIEAVYSSRQATLAVEKTRDDSPMSLLLIEGDFQDSTELKLNEFKDAGPEDVGLVLEKWALRIYGNDVNNKEYSVRYLAPVPESHAKSVSVYALLDGQWTKMDTRSLGSYLAFDAAGDTVVFCAVESEAPLNIWLIVGAALLAAAVVFFVVRGVSKAKKQKLGQQLETPDSSGPNCEDDSAPAPEDTEKPE